LASAVHCSWQISFGPRPPLSEAKSLVIGDDGNWAPYTPSQAFGAMVC
jgi:hypothetical protein